MIVLDIAVFATQGAPWWNVLDPFIQGANYQLASFGMMIGVSPSRPQEPPLILPPATNVRNGYGEPGKLRAAAHKALPQGRGIPVIFTSLSSDAAFTVMRGDKDSNGDVDWLSYILIDVRARNPQLEVLAHELVHAADYSGDTDRFGDIYLHDADPRSLMSQVSSRIPGVMVAMQERHAQVLRKAYFARQL